MTSRRIDDIANGMLSPERAAGRGAGSWRGLALAGVAAWAVGCIEYDDALPDLGALQIACGSDGDCDPGQLCLGGRCVPDDPCGAGIYRVESRVPAYLSPAERTTPFVVRSLLPDPDRFARVSSPVGDRLLTVEAAGTPRLFEADFFVPRARESTHDAVFVEARLRTGGASGPCQAVIELRVPNRHPDVGLSDGHPLSIEARFCIGEGQWGPESGPTDLFVDGIETDVFHTYRIEYIRRAADADDPDEPRFRLVLDGAMQPVEYRASDFEGAVELDRDPLPPRDAFIRFGGLRGTSTWDFVRWGCAVDSGVCLPAMGDFDRRRAIVEDDFDPENAADRNASGICSERRLARGPCDGGMSGRSTAPEVCNGVDDDCDGNTDETFRGIAASQNVALTFYADPEVAADPSAYPDAPPDASMAQLLHLDDVCRRGVCRQGRVACNPALLDGTEPDADPLVCDTSADPDRLDAERCDGLDNDCDGYVDENYRRFADGLLPSPDGRPRPEDPVKRGYATDDGRRAFVGEPCGVGACVEARLACDTTGGSPTYALTCDISGDIRPEFCGNRQDDDCDGSVDEAAASSGTSDRDLDGSPACQHCLLFGRLRDEHPAVFAHYPGEGWASPARGPGAAEAEALIDALSRSFPRDADVLGFDSSGAVDAFDLRRCFTDARGEPLEPMPAYDCDDADADTAYGADELCDLTDNDCDGVVDEVDGPDGQGRPSNRACDATSAAENSQPVCAGDRTGCSQICLAGYDDVDAAAPGCEAALRLEVLDRCDDGDPNAAPVRDPATGRYARDADGQLIDGSGRPLRCGERCDGLDDDGDGEVDEARSLVPEPCYSGHPSEVGPSFDPSETRCRVGALTCIRGQYYVNCDGEVRARAEICNQLDDDCDGLVDEFFLGPDDDVAQAPAWLVERAECSNRNPLGGPCRRAFSRCLPGGADGARDPGFPLPPGSVLFVDAVDRTVCVPEIKPYELSETCNGTDAAGTQLSVDVAPEIDEDCDGAVDEQVGAFARQGRREYPFVEHCGACGNDCAASAGPLHRLPLCVSDAAGYACSGACLDGFVDADGDPDNGCECARVPGATEICDGVDNDCDGGVDEEDGSRRPDGLRDGPGADSACRALPGVRAATCVDGRCVIDSGGCDPDHYDVNGHGGDGCEVGCEGLPAADALGDACQIAMYPDEPTASCACAGVLGCRRFEDGELVIACRTTLAPRSADEPGEMRYAFAEPPGLDEDNPRNRCIGRVGAVAERCDGLDNDCNGQVDEPFTDDSGHYTGIEQGRRVEHCGACDTTCDIANGLPSCARTGDGPSDFACQIDACDGNHGDCNRDIADGCEADRSRDFSHCGACDADCARPRDALGQPSNGEPDRDGDGLPDGTDGPGDIDPQHFAVATTCAPDGPGDLGRCRCGPEDACDPDGALRFCVGEGAAAGCRECRSVNDDPNSGANPDCLGAPTGTHCVEGRCAP